jgi:hypothetical protein
MTPTEKLARTRKRKPKARLMCSRHPDYRGATYPTCTICLKVWHERIERELGGNSHAP